MPKQNHFDFIIVGNGLAGLQLALKFASDAFFREKRIALIDPSPKTKNNKTWSFWETNTGEWNSIIKKSWKTAHVITANKTINLALHPYTYKTIQSIDFYNYCKKTLRNNNNICFILDTIKTLKETKTVTVKGEKDTYTARHVFDSRLPKDFFSKKKKFISIQQHFKGWVIETDKPCFNPDNFSMMDYRFQYKNTTSFIYVLPFSKTRALIEFTFFIQNTVSETIYETGIKNYIQTHLNNPSYTILETEKGTIPMTSFPFWKYHSKLITKIGTGGGWVKASTGYSFKHTEKNISKIIANIKQNKQPSKNLFSKKFKFYDKIFLYVLKHYNEKGVWIFEKFYSKNKIQTMFQFLDEETRFVDDLKIMKSLFSWTFIKAFFKVLFRNY